MKVRLLISITALAIASCAEPIRFQATESRTEAQGVALAIESCTAPQQCDFLYEITNGSDRCVAFSELSLPSRTSTYLDSTLTVSRRITAQPNARARQTWVILQPGGSFRQGVDVRALSGLSDLSGSSMTLTTNFIYCSEFENPGTAVELQSGSIGFVRSD